MDNRYERMKSELGEIAKLIEPFPEALQEKVFDILTGELTNSKSSQSVDSKLTQNSEEHHVAESQISNTGKANAIPVEPQEKTIYDYFGELFEDHGDLVKKFADISLATFAAYYYQNVAPEAERLGEIGNNELEKAFDAIPKRRTPENLNSTFNNAKRKKYLEPGIGKGYFKIAVKGKRHVKNDILPLFDSNNE